MSQRVIVGMSGGVDSSVAAALLVEQGYEVIGVTMRLWALHDEAALPGKQKCCSVEDVDDAVAVAQALDIPHYVLNFERRFQENVVDYFVDEYARGRTPNPCLACNEFIKYRTLLDRAVALDADYLATGHYARVDHGPTRHRLLRAADAGKDQSYVLYTLGQAELSRLLFPIGGHTKDEVRRIAVRFALPVADKPDSEEICFVPNNDYRTFLAERIPQRPGDIVDITTGETVGAHAGISGYTVGQRKGLGAFGSPRYVVGLRPESNLVLIGPDENLHTRVARAERLRFTAGYPPADPLRIEAKIRYKARPAAATLTITGDTADVAFDDPQRAVTPGQALVFYDSDEVLGGGTITGMRDEG
ncbi:MAG: tRNA 2-thiouridine(34) synthase MnmA [Chloroflexi bacterium]|nr:tRNA 2-thiouridine(34) synthase MnmA [Chloroflexota bacterium]